MISQVLRKPGKKAGYLSLSIPISSNDQSLTTTTTLLIHFLPFLLHVPFLRITSLSDNGNTQNDHPDNHPRDIYAEILTEMVFGSKDYTL